MIPTRWFAALILSTVVSVSAAAEANEANFKSLVAPFLDTYCLDCHSNDDPKAKFDLSIYTSLKSIVRDHGHWKHVLQRLESGDMPPKKKRQPPLEKRQEVIDWIITLRRQEANRNAGDPGIVLARRLSNAEYDYTIRDLTRVDIRPTREFPVDPANEAGFDNSGESLTLSPALLKKYLGAARLISEHLILKPEGIQFAPHPVMTDTDRDKFAVHRIIRFYENQNTNLAQYFYAAWQLKTGDQTISSNLSQRYVQTVFELLEGKEHDLGPIANLRKEWREMPTGSSRMPIRHHCQQMSQLVHRLRAPLSPQFEHLDFQRNIHRGAQAFVYWWNRKYRDARRTLNRESVPSDDPATIAAYEKFCSVFPNLFLRSERSRDYLTTNQKSKYNNKGRLLSAGLHSQSGYFRDDRPMYELLLDPDEQRTLDRLWLELDVITRAPVRQYQGMLWFERTDSEYLRSEEFDFARPENLDVVAEPMIKRLAKVYLQKAVDLGATDTMVFAVTNQFRIINEEIRRMERFSKAAEPSHLAAVLDFARRAYRRPLTSPERSDLKDFYTQLRENEEASHEDAIRDLVVSILMSPHFWYRVDLPTGDKGIQPLSDQALASRLSYFLWSSMPDDELLQANLQRPSVLMEQTRRMLNDRRIRGLAVEFAGNWLEFRHFENFKSIAPGFTRELQQAMFEEPTHFFVDVVQSNRSILNFLHDDHTVVNPVLAEFYGLEPVGEWKRVRARAAQRGGLMPMAVFQTYNAGGLRTSPVKRGYWVVRRLLGEHIPPPPPTVPELPATETGDLSIPEQLAAHREHPNCSACHERFDSIGLAFEHYGPIGELRTTDLGGRPVANRVEFPGGRTGTGLEGLQQYLRDQRQNEFVENLCRKLFGYALGRKLMLSDEPAIATMKNELKKNDYRFGTLVETIVTSRQFRFQRGRLNLAEK